MRLRCDSVTASRGNPCLPRGRRSLSSGCASTRSHLKTVEQERRFTTAKIGAAMGGAWKLSLALAAALCAAVLAACGGAARLDLDHRDRRDGAESTVDAGDSSASGGDEAQQERRRRQGRQGRHRRRLRRLGRLQRRRLGRRVRRKGGSSGAPAAAPGVPAAASTSPANRPSTSIRRRSRASARTPSAVPGGDNSIQEYGEEQGADERAAAMKTIADLSTRPSSPADWADGLRDLPLGQQRQSRSNCSPKRARSSKAKAAPACSRGLNRGARASTPRTHRMAASSAFRVEGDTGFAIYWGSRRQGLRLRAQIGRRGLEADLPRSDPAQLLGPIRR